MKSIKLLLLVLLTIYGCKSKLDNKNIEENPIEDLSIEVENNISSEVVSFQKVLTLQNITFEIVSKGEGSIRKLFINTKGLIYNSQELVMDIDGSVIDAEVEDLNIDGYPELLIYTQSAGSGSYGNVIGFSVNNGKSMSQIAFPDLSNNEEASTGYMGHDVFLIGETNLIRKFPIYKEGDTNDNPTGGMRQIQYKLKDGEASRIFVINNVFEYNK